MNSRISLIIASLLLAACSTQIGGDGALSTGEPLSVVMHVDMNAVNSVSTFDILSPDGWSCRTMQAPKDEARAADGREVLPMSCSDGAKGTMILNWDTLQKKHIGVFKLDNGRSGKVVFDYKR